MTGHTGARSNGRRTEIPEFLADLGNILFPNPDKQEPLPGSHFDYGDLELFCNPGNDLKLFRGYDAGRYPRLDGIGSAIPLEFCTIGDTGHVPVT